MLDARTGHVSHAAANAPAPQNGGMATYDTAPCTSAGRAAPCVARLHRAHDELADRNARSRNGRTRILHAMKFGAGVPGGKTRRVCQRRPKS